MFALDFGDLYRGRALIVPALSLQLPAGRPTAIVGVNGAGKSTMLMAAAGILMPSACRMNAHDTNNCAVGYVPQDFPVIPGLRVEDYSRVFGLDFRRMVDALPGLFLHELVRKRTETLSPGQRQALANAIALSVDAELFVFDEPFSALDVRRRTGLRELIRERALHRPTLLASQVGADLITLCDHFVLLRSGRVVFQGPLGALIDEGGTSAAGAATNLAERFELAVVHRIT